MSIPSSFLDELRNRLTLSEVIGKSIKVTRAGREYKACCPFHREKTPSFTINDDKQFYHCFGCGAHGDVVKFTMEHNGLSFPEAVEALAAQAGMQVPKVDRQTAQKVQKTKGLYDLMDEAASWLSQTLDQNRAVLEYAEGRGLDRNLRETFRIGYAPHDGQALRKHLTGQGYSDKQMLETGLLKESSRGGQPYIFFRERLMFPVLDRRGRVVAFGGRILPDHMLQPSRGDFKPPKYLNSPDTPLFDKGHMLYGEWLARPAARAGHSLIVTEGYMDVIACHHAGFKGAVAPMGTALTDEQIVTLWQIQGSESTKNPVLSFDGDNAGRRAAERACDNLLPLLGPGKSANFAFLPEGEDPDSLLQSSGPNGLKNILKGALTLFDFIWHIHTAGRHFETPEARAGLDKDISKRIARITDAQVQRHYRELLRARIREKFFSSSYKNDAKNSTRAYAKPKKPPGLKPHSPARSKIYLLERILLAAILNHPALIEMVEEQLGYMNMRHAQHENLRLKILDEFHRTPDIEIGELHNILRTSGFSEVIDDILCESVYVHAAFCRPNGAQERGEEDLSEKWMALYKSLSEPALGQEVQQGWHQAIMESDEEQEDKLRNLMKVKGSESTH